LFFKFTNYKQVFVFISFPTFILTEHSKSGLATQRYTEKPLRNTEAGRIKFYELKERACNTEAHGEATEKHRGRQQSVFEKNADML